MPYCYGYCRISTTDQSVEQQRDAIKREFEYAHQPQGLLWGDHYGVPEPNGWFIDPGVSGGKPFASRPAGSVLNNIVEPGDVILIAKLDRGFRNTMDCITTVQAWQARGVKVSLLDLKLDTGTAIGEFVLTVIAAIARFERQRMGERQKESKAARRRVGLAWVAQKYGFKLAGPKGRTRFIPDPYTRKIGAQIVEWRKMGMSPEKIYIEFLKQRIRNRKGQEIGVDTIRRWYGYELGLQKIEEEEERKKNGTV